MTFTSLIVGIGHHLPEGVVRNEDLPEPMNADPAGITKRTGIVERRWAAPGLYPSDLGTEAAKRALEDAKYVPEDIDCIIAATLSPDVFFPGIGVYIQTKLGLAGIPAYDVRNQCSGFLYSVNMARAFLAAGIYRRILVVCAELQSHGLGQTMKHAHITPLFGDGAAAVVMAAEPHPDRKGVTFTVDAIKVYADGKHANRLRQRTYDMSCKPFIDWRLFCDNAEDAWYAEMDGQFIFRRAVSEMSKAAREILEQRGLTLDDIAWVLPHQANYNISKTLCSVLKVPLEKMLSNIQRVGNTTAASIPLLLSETVAEGKIKPGDRVLMTTFGAGLTWGAGILSAC
jgi:3-oxoacyl-[acyl-carrier-protein] synthase III